MLHLIKQLLNWLYYENCYFCHKPTDLGLICTKCYDEISLNFLHPIKEIQGIKVFSASRYENILQKLIRGLKYHNKKKLAKPLAMLLYAFWQDLEISKEEFELVPIPLFTKREKQRGYNHAKLLADEFSKLTGYSVNTAIVKRIKSTKPQYKLSKTERAQNMKEAFEVYPEAYNGKNLLIVDDICTSGATVEELIKVLKKKDISNLCVLVAANPI